MSKFYAKTTLSHNHPLNPKKGFTLLEILLVVGIIAILAGIVIVAINPSRQLATVRNTERISDIKQINNALTQYYIDNSRYPASVNSVNVLTEICNTGDLASSTDNVNGVPCGDLVNLSQLVPLYITAIPVDPQGSAVAFLSPLIKTAEAATNGTGYFIKKDSTTNKIALQAVRAELSVPVVINLATTTEATACTSFTYSSWSTCSANIKTRTVSTSNPINCTGGVTPDLSDSCIMTYTVTYNGNTNTSGTVPADQTKTEDVTLTLRTNSGTLAKTGYTFDGWNTAANGSGTSYAVGANYTANTAATMYAKWTVADACSHVPTDPDCWSAEQAGLTWGPHPSTTGVSTDITLSNGFANTAILYGLSNTLYPAAKHCYEKTEGGVPVGTWYLPSINELVTGRGALGGGPGGFPSLYYWSSTEFSDNPEYFARDLASGSIGSARKLLTDEVVRCLR